MPRPYVTFAEYPMDIVRLACTKCERRGQIAGEPNAHQRPKHLGPPDWSVLMGAQESAG